MENRAGDLQGHPVISPVHERAEIQDLPHSCTPLLCLCPPNPPPPHQLPGPWEHAVEKDILLVGTLTVAQPLPSHSAVTLSSLTMNFLSQEPWRMHQM
jgi:hypothetical protein